MKDISAKPNFIFIICDQLRADCIRAYGNETVSTPNVDYFAARGTLFENGYSAVPSCLPARASLMSGQDQWHAGVLGMGWGQGQIPNDYPHTLAGELTKAGYRTHLIGKGHFHPQRTSMGFESAELEEGGRTLMNGFKDEYREYFDALAPKGITPEDHGIDWNSWHAHPWHTEDRLHPTFWTISRAIEFLDTRDKDKPFFLNISFDRPHSPYCPPQRFWDMYINKDLKKADVGEWAEMHDDSETAKDPNAWRGIMTDEEIHRARAGYYGDTTFIDNQIGRLFNWMRRFAREEYQNTWFIFISDHGDMLGDHNLWRKTYAYEGSTKIPFIVCPPFKEGKSERHLADEVVELRDIMPTILEAAGIEIPETVTGKSVLPLMKNQKTEWREYLHGEHCKCYSHEQEMQFVTDGKRKFVWLSGINVEQFFDLDEDPGELNNLIDDPARQDEINKWRGFLVQELESRDCGWVKGGKLSRPEGEPLISPYKEKRWDGN